MDWLHEFLKTAFVLLQVATGGSALYFLFFFLFGVPRRKRSASVEPRKTFAVLVAAHNEEKVIGPLVENLSALNYPKELYDVFVICDNCTDGTARISREGGAFAMERYNSAKKGKGHALEWMLEELWKRPKQYDAVVVLDADNLVENDFLFKMNREFCEGSKVVQAYLDTKNPYDSWVSLSYAITYWYINRLWQLPRQRLGMCNYLCGTGMAFDTGLLREIGWGAHSLTEDIEFTMKCVQRGVYPAWAHDIVVYDEKPVSLRASLKQRLRWMRGHFDCALRFIPALLKQSAGERKISAFDASMFLLQPFQTLASLGLSLVSIVWGLFVGSEPLASIPNWFWIAIAAAVFAQLPLAMFLERAPLKAYWGLLFYPFFLLTWAPLSVIGFFTRKNEEWSHTEHTRDIKVEELARH